VRMRWLIIVWAITTMVGGCALPGTSTRTAQRSANNTNLSALAQYKAVPGTAVQTASFSERITSYLVPSFVRDWSSTNPVAPSVKPRHPDPVSLNYPSAAPDEKLLLSMAQMSDLGGDLDQARLLYRRTIAASPGNLDATLGLARLEDREGRLDQAISIYQQAITVNPSSATAINDLALCYARKGELYHALQLLNSATQLRPGKPLYRNNIAKVLVELNRQEEALSHLSSVHPPAVAHFNLGVLLQQRGRLSEAVQYLTAATHINPQLSEAQILLTQIQPPGAQLASQTLAPQRKITAATVSPYQAASAPLQPPGVGGPQKPSYGYHNDQILPTPLTPPANYGVNGAFPTTGAGPSLNPVAQSVPAITAQLPLGNAPVLLPPIR